MQQIPTYSNYNPKSDNGNTACFTDSFGSRFYFSYTALVAYKKLGEKMVVCQNRWGSTTGKHLNWIDGGNQAERLRDEDFNNKFKRDF